MDMDYSQFKGTYSGESIGVESGLKAIAKQATMYLGSKGPDGLKYQIGEILDNSTDELSHLIAKRTTKEGNLSIEIEFYPDSSVRIRDCGRGVPIGINPKTGRPSIEAVYESTSAGGKSYDVANAGYGKVTRGTHGAGAAVVAATSSFMNVKVTTIEDDCTYTIRYGYQQRTHELTKIGHMKQTGFSYGTEVHWHYDENIFKAVDASKGYPFKMEEIENMLVSYCYSLKDITFKLKYTLPGQQPVYKEFNSNDYDLQLLIAKNSKGPIMDATLDLKDGEYKLRIICGMAAGSSVKYIYTNGLTMERSSQSTIFPKEMVNTLEELLKRSGVFKQEYPIQFRPESGLNYALMLDANNPEYTAQHKNQYSDTIFERLLTKALMPFILQNGGNFIKELFLSEKEKYIKMVEKAEQRKKANVNMKQFTSITAEESRYMEDLTSSTADPSISDLLIFEGHSAAKIAKPILKKTQALTYQNGLFPNALIMEEEKFSKSTHFEPIKKALSMYWKRIVIISDPDPIGGFIQCLLLTMLSKYYPQYIQLGKVYILRAPLYIAYPTNGKPIYLYTEEEKLEYMKTMSPTTAIDKNKGIGSLSVTDMQYLLDYTDEDWDNRLEKIDPQSFKEGQYMIDLLFGANQSYRKNYVLSIFGTHPLKQYYDKKKYKKATQRIGFNLTEDGKNLSQDLGYIGNSITEDDFSSIYDALDATMF
ncbi:ATP-binding protein [Clostridium tertium]|uniref:ATP-binding protein n=1 Tax=Clostridium tertium TaxID=1559 RepID=UPI0023B3040C|nr:ATP-binding protein [Clostridium tertium]